MKTYQQSGDVLVVTAPAAALSGRGMLVGSIFGVTVNDATIGADVAIKTTGVFELAKTGSQAWAIGDRIYWDAANLLCTSVSAGNYPIGAAVATIGAGEDETTGVVRLDGVATVAAAD